MVSNMHIDKPYTPTENQIELKTKLIDFNREKYNNHMEKITNESKQKFSTEFDKFQKTKAQKYAENFNKSYTDWQNSHVS